MINKFFIVNVYSCSGKESSEASFKYTQTIMEDSVKPFAQV